MGAGPRSAPIGTTVRVVLGLGLLAYGLSGGKIVVSHGRLQFGFEPLGLILGVVPLPVVLLIGQSLRARRDPSPFQATGAVETTINMAVFFALFLTPGTCHVYPLPATQPRSFTCLDVAGRAARLRRM
jgi:hypothetical protein